jgi:hypothetical protein
MTGRIAITVSASANPKVGKQSSLALVSLTQETQATSIYQIARTTITIGSSTDLPASPDPTDSSVPLAKRHRRDVTQKRL